MTPAFTLLENVPLAPRTTLGVGGPARYFAAVASEDAIRAALAWARDRGVSVMVLGGGSNLLVADRGLEALVLRICIPGLEVSTSDSAIRVRAGAGEPWDPFVARAVAAGWAGIECLSGIPGDVGSTPIQNVGAYGQEVADTIASVEAIDRSTGELLQLPAAECGFSYRDSLFKRTFAGRFVLTRVTFQLTPGGPPAIRYAELARAFAGTTAPSLALVRTTILALRRSKSMVYDPADENHRSAGSFFTNPIVDATVLAHARAAATALLRPTETMPEFPAERGLTKLSAGWLIERAGFAKGSGDGPVGLSTNHALALVNRGGATAAQLIRFATTIKRGVFDRFGVTLTPEPVLAGFDPDETAALLARPPEPAIPL